MERLPKLDLKAFVAAMQEDFEKTMRAVGEAVNAVPEGNVFNTSEEQVRDVLAEFRAKAYQQAIQMRIDAAEAAFSPCGQGDGKAAAGQRKS